MINNLRLALPPIVILLVVIGGLLYTGYRERSLDYENNPELYFRQHVLPGYLANPGLARLFADFPDEAEHYTDGLIALLAAGGLDGLYERQGEVFDDFYVPRSSYYTMRARSEDLRARLSTYVDILDRAGRIDPVRCERIIYFEDMDDGRPAYDMSYGPFVEYGIAADAAMLGMIANAGNDPFPPMTQNQLDYLDWKAQQFNRSLVGARAELFYNVRRPVDDEERALLCSSTIAYYRGLLDDDSDAVTNELRAFYTLE